MMCVCGCSQILLECNHVGCKYSDNMRGELMAALDRGDSDDLALQAFVQKYGTTVIAAPTTTGFNRVAWIMPYLALVLGLTTVVLIVRTWRHRPLVLPAGSVAPVSGAELEHFRAQARKDTEV
jgi:cytochrome c-type biogenesis protein CcmH